MHCLPDNKRNMKYSEPTVGAKADKAMPAAYRNPKTIVTDLHPNISTSGVMKTSLNKMTSLVPRTRFYDIMIYCQATCWGIVERYMVRDHMCYVL